MGSWLTALNWGQFTFGHATDVAYTITKATISIYQQRSASGPAQSRLGFRLRQVAVVPTS
jgi:hypothetical protein